MSTTIKVIDLLNKIANGEIKEGQRFNIKFGDMYRKCYFTTDEDKEYCGGLDFFKNCSDNYSVYDSLTLNEEVELIEEEPEIDEIGKMAGWALVSLEENIEEQKENINFTLDFFGKKINEIIFNQNKIAKAINQINNK